MTEEIFNSIMQWQNETFPHATALSKVVHLTSEVEELRMELITQNNDPKVTHLEYADCFLLLMGSAASYGMTFQDICEVINKKMGINKKRKWGNPDKDGVVNHVK